MAPFNLENNIREKLENRELQPSADSWKKLESQLGNSEPVKKTTQWYFIAASVVGLLIVTSVFLNRNTVEVKNSIVDQNIEKVNELEIKTEIVSETPKTWDDETPAEENNSGNEIKQTEKKLNPEPPQTKSVVEKKFKKSDALASLPNDETKENLKEREEKVAQDPEIIFNTKIDEVVTSVKSLQKEKNEVTEEEVEMLLNNARRDIQTQRILNNSKVDAAALLDDVEWELEKSFRDKVFDALGEGFRKLRIAISQRNE